VGSIFSTTRTNLEVISTHEVFKRCCRKRDFFVLRSGTKIVWTSSCPGALEKLSRFPFAIQVLPKMAKNGQQNTDDFLTVDSCHEVSASCASYSHVKRIEISHVCYRHRCHSTSSSHSKKTAICAPSGFFFSTSKRGD